MQIELEKLKFGLTQMLSKEAIIDARVDVQEYLIDNIRVSVRGFIWAERTDEEHMDTEYPATWWDMFKLDKFPAWALKRWPPKMITERITTKVNYIAYPNFRMPTRGNHKTVIPIMEDTPTNEDAN